jgi:hypothetical protein
MRLPTVHALASLGLAFVPAVLAGCAASSGERRVVLLESDSYRCGAAEGLGCGLALAPVLDAIDGLDGVAASAVSWDGTRFRIEVRPGADPDRIAAAAAALLEGESCCVVAPRGEAAPAEPGEWFDSERTLALSRHEAGVIAADFTARIAAEATLDAAAAERLHALLRGALEDAFERAHAAGGGVPRLWEELPRARAAFESRLDFLAPEERATVAAALDRELREE